MRDGNQTGYAPKPIEGVTPDQRIEVDRRSVPCDGEIAVPRPRPSAGLAADPAGEDQVTCPYCSITYVLKAGAGGGRPDH